MSTQVIVLNGGSSAGKSSLARALQAALPEPWLTLGVNTFLGALPASMRAGGEGIEFGAGGEVNTGPVFGQLDRAWSVGVAAMARAGARIIVDEVFLGGAALQVRWQGALADLEVLQVSERCAPEVAAQREQARSDRVPGMAQRQADLVHQGVIYDLEVDTAALSPQDAAQVIVARLR